VAGAAVRAPTRQERAVAERKVKAGALTKAMVAGGGGRGGAQRGDGVVRERSCGEGGDGADVAEAVEASAPVTDPSHNGQQGSRWRLCG